MRHFLNKKNLKIYLCFCKRASLTNVCKVYIHLSLFYEMLTHDQACRCVHWEACTNMVRNNCDLIALYVTVKSLPSSMCASGFTCFTCSPTPTVCICRATKEEPSGICQQKNGLIGFCPIQKPERLLFSSQWILS